MPIGQQSEEGCAPPTARVYEALGFMPEVIRGLAFWAVHSFVWLGDYNWLLWGSLTRTFDLYAFDAETGKSEWIWPGPTYHRKMNWGDEDGWLPRFQKGIRTAACPTPWSQPRIDSAGTI